MNKGEFIRILRIALASQVHFDVVNENVAYYENYIDMEVKKGKTEEKVIEELGDPRLIAKTIIETNKLSGNAGKDNENTGEGTENGKHAHIPVWLMYVIAIIVLIVIISLLVSAVSVLLPILVPVIIVIMVIQYVNKGK